MGLRETVFAATDSTLIKVNVPEWGIDVWIRVISGKERDAFEDALVNQNATDIKARFLVFALADEKGVRLFSDTDRDQLNVKSGKVLNRLYEIAMRHNSVSKEEVEKYEKNS